MLCQLTEVLLTYHIEYFVGHNYHHGHKSFVPHEASIDSPRSLSWY